MSGYACIVNRSGGPVTGPVIRALLPALRPRGPDGDECWYEGSLGVATTRLDPGDARLAPTRATVGDRYVVVGQVRIDDRDAVVRRLAAAGCEASAKQPDVALFAHGWATFGEAWPIGLLGDFSVVVHDLHARSTTLVRDPFGIRMLYYALTPHQLATSNTLAAVLASPGVSRELNDDAIADFIAVGMNEDLTRTTYRKVDRVPPAHFARIGPEGGAHLVRYWSLPERPEIRRRSDADYVDGFREALQSSVRDRLRAPSVAVLMSGGLDSTSLASFARHALPPGAPIAALTVRSRSASDAELGRARLAAASLGLAHELIDSEQFACMAAMDDPSLGTPEPYDESDLAVWRTLLATAGRASRVVLYGEDPDTILSPPDLPELLRAASPWRIAFDIASHVTRTRTRPHLGIRDRLRSAKQGGPEETGGPAWLDAALRRRRAGRAAERVVPRHRTRPDVARHLGHPLWQSVLESLDAGVHGIPMDVRLPYVDLRVVDYAMTLPAIPWLQRKRVLREAMKGLLPEEVRAAPKRGVPGMFQDRIRQWWTTNPAPFTPSPALARFLDVAALQGVTPESDQAYTLVHLRLRILDRWLRDQAQNS